MLRAQSSSSSRRRRRVCPKITGTPVTVRGHFQVNFCTCFFFQVSVQMLTGFSLKFQSETTAASGEMKRFLWRALHLWFLHMSSPLFPDPPSDAPEGDFQHSLIDFFCKVTALSVQQCGHSLLSPFGCSPTSNAMSSHWDTESHTSEGSVMRGIRLFAVFDDLIVNSVISQGYSTAHSSTLIPFFKKKKEEARNWDVPLFFVVAALQ